ILMLLLLLPFSNREPGSSSRDATSNRQDLPVRGQQGLAHPPGYARQRPRYGATSEPRNETLLREAAQIPAAASPDPRRARTECLLSRCPDNRQLPDKCPRAACAA